MSNVWSKYSSLELCISSTGRKYLRQVLVAAADDQAHPDRSRSEREMANGPHPLQKGRPRELGLLRPSLPQTRARREERGPGRIVDKVTAAGPVAEQTHFDVAVRKKMVFFCIF